MHRASPFFILLSAALGCGDDGSSGPLDAGPDGGARDSGAGGDGGGPDGHVADGGTDAGPMPTAWTFIVLPDTQYLSESHPDIFDAQARWIVEQRDTLDIRFVLHCGDIVNQDVGAQWDEAFDALHMLDGVVPYVLAPGNHDYTGNAGSRSTMINAYFPLSDFEVLETFGGSYETDRVENTYHVFDTPTGPWLAIALEFGPRDPVVDWAGEVAALYPDARAVVVTHAYMYSDDTRYDWATYGASQSWNPHSYGIESDPEGVNDAQEMFDAFIFANDNIDLVVSGHVLNDGLGRLESTQESGGAVHQILANYQFQPMGGAGFLRIMSVAADGRTIDVTTYSPYLDEYKTDADNQFTVVLEPR